MKYRLVIFDLDGTILDTLEDLTDSVNYALGQYNFPARDIDDVRNFVGNGIAKLIERAVPPDTEDDIIKDVLDCFKENYRQHCADKTKPYDGILEFVKDIRDDGCLTAVVSNKADFAVQELCKKYFPECFDFVVGERSGIRRKPSPDSVIEVMDKLGMDRESTVYIGDSDVDIKLAKNAGIEAVLVDWGFRSRDLLVREGAKKIVSSPKELKKELQ